MSDYKSTLNLPETGFPMKANLTQREPQRLKQWGAMSLYQKMRDAGVRYMLFSDGGSGIEGLRAFSKEIIPAFFDAEDDSVIARAAE